MRRDYCAAAAALAATILVLALSTPALAQDDAACPTLKQVARIQMARDPNARFWVPISFGDVHKYMLLNLNEPTVVYREFAEDSHFVITAVKDDWVFDMHGSTSTRKAHTGPLTIGPVPVAGDNGYYMLSPLGNPGYQPGSMEAGMLGINELRGFDIDLDFGKGLLNLFSPEHCDGKVVYWNTDTVAIMPVSRNSFGQFTVPVKVDGVDLVGVIMPSFAVTSLNQNIAEDKLHFNDGAGDVERVKSGNTDIYRKNFQTVDISGVTFTNMKLDVIPDKVHRLFIPGGGASSSASINSGASAMGGPTLTITSTPAPSVRLPEDVRLPDVLIGADVLSKLHIYFATKERKLYVSLNPAPPPEAR